VSWLDTTGRRASAMQWACTACTFLNTNPMYVACEVCGTTRRNCTAAPTPPSQINTSLARSCSPTVRRPVHLNRTPTKADSGSCDGSDCTSAGFAAAATEAARTASSEKRKQRGDDVEEMEHSQMQAKYRNLGCPKQAHSTDTMPNTGKTTRSPSVTNMGEIKLPLGASAKVRNTLRIT
jgi:hypothetical protein